MARFYVNQVTAVDGKIAVDVISLGNQDIKDAIRALHTEAKVRGLSVPEFEATKTIVVNTPELDDAEKAMVETDRKIQAIKAYRARNPGMGLKDAKDACDAYREKWERDRGMRW